MLVPKNALTPVSFIICRFCTGNWLFGGCFHIGLGLNLLNI